MFIVKIRFYEILKAIASPLAPPRAGASSRAPLVLSHASRIQALPRRAIRAQLHAIRRSPRSASFLFAAVLLDPKVNSRARSSLNLILAQPDFYRRGTGSLNSYLGLSGNLHLNGNSSLNLKLNLNLNYKNHFFLSPSPNSHRPCNPARHPDSPAPDPFPLPISHSNSNPNPNPVLEPPQPPL